MDPLLWEVCIVIQTIIRQEAGESRKMYRKRAMSTRRLERRVERSHNMVRVDRSVATKAGKQNHHEQHGHYPGGPAEPQATGTSSGAEAL